MFLRYGKHPDSMASVRPTRRDRRRPDKGNREGGEVVGEHQPITLEPSVWERMASGLAAIGTFAFFFSAVGYGWYSLLVAMAG